MTYTKEAKAVKKAYRAYRAAPDTCKSKRKLYQKYLDAEYRYMLAEKRLIADNLQTI